MLCGVIGNRFRGAPRPIPVRGLLLQRLEEDQLLEEDHHPRRGATKREASGSCDARTRTPSAAAGGVENSSTAGASVPSAEEDAAPGA